MSRLLVIVPSRGRPKNAARLAEVFTDPGVEASLLVVVDDDDDELDKYVEHFHTLRSIPTIRLAVGPRKRLGPTLNEHAVAEASRYDYLGFMGDDHAPRTANWDWHITRALDNPRVGIAYGDDGFQHQALPTAVFMRAAIVEALGYMAFPGAVHLFLDNCWLGWGQGARCLAYLPHVTIEHLHYQVGKAPWDERYGEVNSSAMWDHDRLVWEEYNASGRFGADVEKIKAVMAQ